MFSPNTSKDKVFSTTIEDAAKMLLQVWDEQRDVTFIDGVACYLHFTDDGVHFTAGTSKIEIDRSLDYSRKQSIKDPNVYLIKFTFHSMDINDRFPYEPLTLNKDHAIMHYITMGKESSTIEIPYEAINEVDFFQYETLGVICPLTATTLTKLITIMRELL